MKNVRKIFAVLTAIMMMLSVTAVASADTLKGTITVEGEGGAYNGYKLLNATNAEDEDGNGTDKYAYTLNDTYTSILESVTGKNEQSEIVKYIESLSDDDAIRDFADEVYRKILSTEPAITPDAEFVGGTPKEVDQGYWLISDVTTFEEGSENTLYSLVMLDTAGKDAIEVNVKKDVPTVKKEVEEINDSVDTDASWGDAADYDIGDEINFKLTGTVDGNIGSYEKYYYEFHDTMKKMTYVDKSVKVVIDDNDYTSYFTVNWDEDTKELNVSINDLLSIMDNDDKPIIKADSNIVVTYTATLDEDAVIGKDGNPNEVYLEYSNNPYDSSEGEEKPSTGNTPKDTVVVFTYQLVVDKVDGEAEERTLLPGAGFTLYKWVADNNDYIAVGDEITGVTEFEFKGLDAGTYKLVETTIPAGYNKADDVEFVVVSTFDESKDPAELTNLIVEDKDGSNITANDEDPSLPFNVEISNGKVSTDIVNFAGSELPSTGGIGTVLFYVVGGVVFAGALVLLIAKLRMKYQSEN